MITYVNSKEAKLFEMAAEALGVDSLDVDQYLSSLGTLKAISPKYVRLPLYEEGHRDEEIFEIDANTRTIQIPASFKKNGIGVVSDQLAETVWFKINRYFDIKDFGKAIGTENGTLKDGNLHILIQWEAPDGAKGASWALAIDGDTDPEYIYFGWAITADHLTAKMGNIRFAVRIMQYNANNNICYSFATQAAAIAVKANLSFDLTDEDVEIENVADKVASVLMDGQIAYCPVFDEDDGNLPFYILNLEGNPAKAKLEVKAAAPEGESYDAVVYKWYHKGLDDDEFKLVNPQDQRYEGQYTPALTVTSSGHYYVVVFGMKEIIDNNEIIYKGRSEDVLYTAEEAAAELERATNAGEDPAFVEGDVKTPGAAILSDPAEKFRYHTSVASSKSNVCEIPSPTALEITTDVDGVLVLTPETNNLVVIVKRQTVSDPPIVVGKIALAAHKTPNATKVEEEIPDEEFSQDVAILANENAEGPGVYFEVNPETSDEVVIHMDKADEGYYKFEIINQLNGNEVSVDSKVCRVVNPAVAPTVEIKLLNEDGTEVAQDVEEGYVRAHNKLKAIASVASLSDKLDIQWYKVGGEAKDPDPNGADDDILIEGATDEIFVPDDDARYYFKATNWVEGTSAFTRSNVIIFNA